MCHPTLSPLHPLLSVSLFGTDLTAVCPPGGIPTVVDACIEIVEDRGIGLEGVYRVGSRQNGIIAIKKQFEQGWGVGLKCKRKLREFPILTCVLLRFFSQYLSSLPIPPSLIPTPTFMKMATS